MLPLLHVDQSSRIRMPPTPISNSPASTSIDDQTRAPATAVPQPPVSSRPVENTHGRIDQLGLVRSQLQSGALPTLVTEMTMLIAQMQLVETHPDFVLSFSVGMVKNSFDALMPSTSADPQHLIGSQANPELQERQKEQQKAEKQAANTPKDLRDVLNQKEQKSKLEQLIQKKRTRDLANSYAASLNPNPSPVQQPEARSVRISKKLLSHTETRQHDISARDAVRLQREIQSGNPDSGLAIQKFETATSKGEPENVRTLEKASVGKKYLRSQKKPTLLLNRIPPWFERVKEDLHREKSPSVKRLPSKVKLGMQRPARYDEQLRESATLRGI